MSICILMLIRRYLRQVLIHTDVPSEVGGVCNEYAGSARSPTGCDGGVVSRLSNHDGAPRQDWTMASGCAISLGSDWMTKCASEHDVEERGLDHIKINGVECRV